MNKNREKIDWSYQFDEWTQGRLTFEEQKRLFSQLQSSLETWDSLLFSHLIGQYFHVEKERRKNNLDEEQK
ncbi:MAG: hypothetical protein AAF985_19915 [Bacteroidota bacterium]